MRIALVQFQPGPRQRATSPGPRRGAGGRGPRRDARGVSRARLHAVLPVLPLRAGAPLDLAEPVPGPTTDAFCRLAAELGVVVVLNLYEREGERAYDSSPVIDADGRLLGTTRMLHVAQMPCFYEQDYYTPGDHGMPVYETAAGPHRRGDLLRPSLSRGHAEPGPAGRRPRGGPPGRHGGGVAGRPLRSRAARRGVPERLLHRAGEPRRRASRR